MSSIKRSALVHYSPAEMYELVNNVGDYASFLPWCKSSTVLSETDDEMEASIEMKKGILHKTFTTHNRLSRDRKIEISLVNGPFRKLCGHWAFEPMKVDNACRVILELEFEFDSAMMSVAAAPIFTQIANSLVDAFVKRAAEVYGERG